MINPTLSRTGHPDTYLVGQDEVLLQEGAVTFQRLVNHVCCVERSREVRFIVCLRSRRRTAEVERGVGTDALRCTGREASFMRLERFFDALITVSMSTSSTEFKKQDVL